MMFRRLLRKRRPVGVLTGIYVAEQAGAPMQERGEGELLAGRGLAADRYAEGRGYYRLTDACQVTVIDGRALARIERRTGVGLGRGQHRRNLVVEGVELRDLRPGTALRIGPAVLEVARPRPPCGYLERLTEPGIVRALRRDAGLCLRVVTGGLIRRGDRVIPG